MSKEEYIALSTKQLKEKCNIDADAALMEGIVKHLGIAAMGGDASLVSCEQESELKTIKESFLFKKLGLKDGASLDAAIKKACDALGSSNPLKRRAAFYYLLCKEFGINSL
ncbi:DUF2853 family protein [Namhaeicola litoreus]|uniref:DUF2853 family protein n=1 Tax=Namhaeicola litoreus TaxID=1052145 RepID=A0ABW3Y419_9FLAO